MTKALKNRTRHRVPRNVPPHPNQPTLTTWSISDGSVRVAETSGFPRDVVCGVVSLTSELASG